VSRDWQGKGLGKILMQKLCEAARENGISGLVAYTMPRNQGLIKLFKSLPYKSRTVYDGEIVELTCMFNEIESY
jgi:L-amino acid N-acyltransferase YncA